MSISKKEKIKAKLATKKAKLVAKLKGAKVKKGNGGACRDGDRCGFVRVSINAK